MNPLQFQNRNERHLQLNSWRAEPNPCSAPRSSRAPPCRAWSPRHAAPGGWDARSPRRCLLKAAATLDPRRRGLLQAAAALDLGGAACSRRLRRSIAGGAACSKRPQLSIPAAAALDPGDCAHLRRRGTRFRRLRPLPTMGPLQLMPAVAMKMEQELAQIGDDARGRRSRTCSR